MSLPRSEGAVSGWTPSLFDDDVVDVDFRNLQDMKSSASQNTYALGSSRSAYTRESILTSSDYVPAFNHSEITSADKVSSSAFAISSSDRRALRNKLRDPSWVPRPRNAFIIFRCDYAREHARDAQAQTMLAKPSDKTLSKRAAEAWKKLTDDEKATFQARAEAEKDEHARQNPQYRFKPVRRFDQHGSTSQGGSTSRHSSRAGSRQSSRGGSVSRGRGERASHSASRRRMGSNFADNVHGWGGDLTTSMEESGIHYRGRSPPPGGRRRSSSMPESIVSEQDVDAWPPTLGPPSCSSSPGPWYDQTQGSSDSGDGVGDDELSPLDSFGGAVDDALFNNFSFPSSTTYNSSQASLVGRPGLYPSQSFPAQSQSSLITVRQSHPAASQASLLTVRPGRHFPGASQSSLLTVRPRRPSQASLIGLRPAPPRQRPVPAPPQIPVFLKPKPPQLSSLSSLSTALADFSYDINAPPAPTPVSVTPSDASDQHPSYSSDSETEGHPQHMPMSAPGLPIPRPRPHLPQPQPQSQPPPQPPPPPPSLPHAATHPVPILSVVPGATGGMDQPHAGSWSSDVFEPQPLPPPPRPPHTTSVPVPIPSPGSADSLSQPHTASWASDAFEAGGALDPQPWDARSLDSSNADTSLPPGAPPTTWDNLDAFGAPPAPPAASSTMDADIAHRVFWDAEAFGGFQDAPASQGQFGAQEFMPGEHAMQEFGVQEYVQQEPIQQEYVQQELVQQEYVQQEPVQQGYMQHEPIQQNPIQQNPVQQDPMQAQIQMYTHDLGRLEAHLEARGQLHTQELMYGQSPMQMPVHLRAQMQMQMHAQDPGVMLQNSLQMHVPDPVAGYGALSDLAGLEDFL